MKRRGSPSRDWTRVQTDKDSPCRVCGSEGQTERAHIVPRAFDERRGSTRHVNPDNILPLCREDHQAFDSGSLDVLEFLTVPEQVHAVKVLGGIEQARRRLAALDYRPGVERARVEARMDLA